jgi:hypothetical protein
VQLFISIADSNETGGDLILPDFGLRIEYNPRDLCLFHSRVIRHGLGSFKGERGALVLFTHDNDLELGMGIERLDDEASKKKPVPNEEEESDDGVVEEDTDNEGQISEGYEQSD